MGDLVMYLCRLCGQQSGVEAGEPAPFCCGQEMELLPFCRIAADPEMTRNYVEEEPCDDGRVKGRKS